MVPDIIITDLQMPKMTGFELIRAVRANPRIASIPIVALASKQVAINPAENHADYAICKDIDSEEQLQTALAAALKTP
jgi:CheY-like chemotaxis protein